MANSKNQRKTPRFDFFWMYGLMALFLCMMLWMYSDGGVPQEVSWTQFDSIVNQGGVKSMTVYTNKDYLEAVLTDSVAKQLNKTAKPAEAPMLGQ